MTALRTAVKSISADKGLFVATNGKYLKRKNVKIDDPFYLSEDERKAILEKVCKSEPDLEFWGFEHGKDSLVLGAFGCSAYALPPSAVAPLFREVMEEPEFRNKFKLLVFAILERPRRPHGFDGHFAPFYREFGAYTAE